MQFTLIKVSFYVGSPMVALDIQTPFGSLVTVDCTREDLAAARVARLAEQAAANAARQLSAPSAEGGALSLSGSSDTIDRVSGGAPEAQFGEPADETPTEPTIDDIDPAAIAEHLADAVDVGASLLAKKYGGVPGAFSIQPYTPPSP